MQDLLFTAGSIIDDKYEIISCLGKGGMGTVYQAKQEGLGRIVALKVLQASLTTDNESWSRFEREALSLAQLSHRNIATFFSYGIWQERVPYIAMELLDGPSLAETIAKEEKIGWRRSLKLACQICQAMAYAHEAGIVHRDLKPSNVVLITDKDDGEIVKIMDFGLAKLFHPDGREAQKLTQTGMLVGSVQYLSPEQSKGLKADHRSDIYAVGCILYECLTGTPPFSADNAIGIIHKHAHEVPAPASARLKEKLASGLDDVLLKALAKEPIDRYQSMSDLRNDLNEILLGTGNISVNNARSKMPPAGIAKVMQSRNPKVAIIAIAIIAVSTIIIGIKVSNKQPFPTSDSFESKSMFTAAEKEFGEGVISCGQMDNLGAIKHFQSCVDRLKGSHRPRSTILLVRALGQIGNCYTNLNQLDEAEKQFTRAMQLMDTPALIRAMDRKTTASWTLHTIGDLVNLFIRKKDFKNTEKYLEKYEEYVKANASIVPQGKQTYMALKSNLLRESGHITEAISFSERAREDCRKNHSLMELSYRFYLDNLHHLIRLHVTNESSPSRIEELKQEYLNCLKTYKPQYLPDVGVQLNIMAAELEKHPHGKAKDGIKFWKDGRQILISKDMWTFANEVEYGASLFAPFLERDGLVEKTDADSARIEFLRGFKNEEGLTIAHLGSTAVAASQGIGRWLSRKESPAASLAFWSEVKEAHNARNFPQQKFYMHLLHEMVMIGSQANSPDSFPEKKELESLLRKGEKLAPGEKGSALCALAHWDLQRGRLDAAKKEFVEAAEVLRDGKQVSSSDAESFAYVQIAVIYDRQKNYAEAERYYRKVLESVRLRRKGNEAAYKHWVKACNTMANGTAPNMHKKFLDEINAEIKR
jgi:serine/threonine protein kinase